MIPLRAQAARLQGRVGAAEERLDALGGRVVVQDLVGEPLEGAVVDDRQDAGRSVIDPPSEGDVPAPREYPGCVAS